MQSCKLNPDSDSWNEALLLDRAGKSTGKNRTWFNIKDLPEDKHISVNFSKIKIWRKINEKITLANWTDNNINVLQAKKVELQNWDKHKVYEEAKDSGQKVILVTWVIIQK